MSEWCRVSEGYVHNFTSVIGCNRRISWCRKKNWMKLQKRDTMTLFICPPLITCYTGTGLNATNVCLQL